MEQVETATEQPFTFVDQGDKVKITDGKRSVTLEKDRYEKALDLKAESIYGKDAAQLLNDEYARVETQVIRDFLTLEGQTNGNGGSPLFVSPDDYEVILGHALLKAHDDINALVDQYGSASTQVDPVVALIDTIRREQGRVAEAKGEEPPAPEPKPCAVCGQPRSERLIELGIAKCLSCRQKERPDLYREW